MTTAARASVLEKSGVRTNLPNAFPGFSTDQLYASTLSWPRLEGCVGILCTSRSGSTLLCREIEQRFAVGEVGESLNPPILKIRADRAGLETPGDALRHTMRSLMENRWFGFKAGPSALLVAEQSGLMSRYSAVARFLFLLRRDIVAQGVSLAKADITSRFHSNQPEKKRAVEQDYSAHDIVKRMKQILQGVRILQDYLLAAGRPFERVFYENFEHGNIEAINAPCDLLGMPRRTTLVVNTARLVERISDEVNVNWCARFHAETNRPGHSIVDDYARLLQP